MSLPDDLPETMGIERAMLARVARRTEQWARAVERAAMADGSPDDARVAPGFAEQHHREAASLFAIAGSYWLMLDARRAADPLQAGARHLVAVGSSYAHSLAVCSADDDREWLDGSEPSDRPLTATDRALVLLRLGWLDARQPESDATRQALFAHMDLAAAQAPSEVGRLRMPLYSTMRVIEAVDSMVHGDGADDIGRLVDSVREFLTRAHEVTAAAMNDRFHWRNLMSSVLPVEPEAAALGAVVMACAMRQQAAEELIERLDLGLRAIAPLVVGRAIAQRPG